MGISLGRNYKCDYEWHYSLAATISVTTDGTIP